MPVAGIPEALAETTAVRVLVCNVMTQPGETDGFAAVDHVQAITRHGSQPVFDYVLLNNMKPGQEVLARYEAEGAHFVEPTAQQIAKLGFIPVCRHLIAKDNLARHNPDKLTAALLEIAAKHSNSFL